ncbi:MAG TPA: YkgJ family cysteine cluster protein [Terracidiphilus sp.]
MAADAPDQPAPAAVKATFSIPIGRAALTATVQLPTSRTTLTELLPILQNLENAIVSRVGEEAAAAGRPISCRAGCGACCRQMVPVSIFEAEALTAWLATLPEDRLASLRERFHRALSALRDAGVLDSILDGTWVLDEERSTQLAIDYFHAGVPCPFLEDESCSIHPIRPLACREYLVTSSPDLCRDPSVNDVSGIHLPLRLTRAIFAFGEEIEHDRRGWIPLVFLLAWAKSGARPGDLVAASGPELLKKFLDRLFAVSNPDPGAQTASPA